MNRKLIPLMLFCMTALALAEEKPLRFTPLSIKDPGINNVEAIRFLIPSGWKSEGGVVWMMDHWIQASLKMRLFNPNGSESITILPADTFFWQPGGVFGFAPGQRYMGSIVNPLPDNAPAVITQVIVPAMRRTLRDVRPNKAEDLPKLAEVIGAANQEPGLQKTCKAARVRYAYQEDGQEYEEDIYAVVIYTPMPQINATSYQIERAYCVRAAKGKLDAVSPILTVMLTSAHIGEDWLAGYMYVQQLRNQGIQQSIKDAGDLSRRIAQNSEEIRQMNKQSYEARQASEDRVFRGISQSIRGVEDYQVPGETTRIELPNGYNHAYYNKAGGEYILTNDANYNPNQQTNQTWEPLERAR